MVSKRKLERPTSQLVNKYLTEHGNNDQYKKEDEAFGQLIQQYPTNEKITGVILKATVINAIEGTNIFGIYQVAEQIKNMNIDRSLKDESPDLVDDIANITISISGKRSFAFASKYCHHHNQEAYPKCDKYVREMLKAYRDERRFQFNGFNSNELIKNFRQLKYSRFKDILTNFRKHFNLIEFTFRQIDIFLWMYGKQCFPPKYKKKINQKPFGDFNYEC